MNIRKLTLFLGLMVLLWALLALVAIDIIFAIGEPHILLGILAIFYPAFLPGALIWMGLSAGALLICLTAQKLAELMGVMPAELTL